MSSSSSTTSRSIQSLWPLCLKIPIYKQCASNSFRKCKIPPSLHSFQPTVISCVLRVHSSNSFWFSVVRIKEELFWRNYFYRVSLIRQSTELSNLSQGAGNRDSANPSSDSSSDDEDKTGLTGSFICLSAVV